jgi:hypothetical protein
MLSGGEQLSKYRLERALGSGGAASVWLAADTKLGRRVAIKLLARPFDQQVAQRFVHEARTIARLSSDHTVRIYDVDTLPDGTPFIAMEYLQGRSLAETIADQPLAPRVAVDYTLQACEALAEAHAAHIIHRDIKPGNLVLTEGPGKQPRLKLVDFGIAKVTMTWREPETTPRTSDGAVMGTPFYMSPEQIRSPSDVDARTDIWSLGVVLFELITGTRPFDTPTLSELIAKILESRPKPVPAAVPEGVRDAIRRCLEKDRDKRFPNVAALARAIAPFASDRAEAMRLADRAAGYLDDGVAAAKTMIGLPRALDDTLATRAAALITITPATGDPWHALASAVPQPMAGDRAALCDVFSRVFERSEPVASNLVKLVGSSLASDEPTEFFALFMGHEVVELGKTPALGEATFAMYVTPLRSHLEQLGAAQRKVVIVVAGVGELGPGVRDSIGEYRRTLNTYVVPIWLREIQRAHIHDLAWDMIEHRLHDLHANQDPFVSDLDSLDPMRCVGMGSRVNEVLSGLKDGGRILNITALPGSGKSTLVRLVQYELADRSFIVLRCSEGGRSVRALGHEILSRIACLAGSDSACEAPPSEVFSEALSSQLRVPFLPRKAFATSLQQLSKPPVLVLEDADWLIALIASPCDTVRRGEARALWTALGEVARKHKLDVVLTSVRGAELDHAMFDGWENPTRPHSIAIARLSLRETQLLVRELSAGIARFSEDATEALHRATHGNVGLTLTVCSTAFCASAQRAGSGPLIAAVITTDDIAHAVRRVASLDKPIGPLFNSLLDDNERQVLRVIASAPARSFRPIRHALKDHAAVERAMSELQAMGLVDFERMRYRVTIPVLAAWAKRHLVRTEYQAANAWRRRTRLVAIGAIFSTLLFAAYFVWLRNQRSDLQVDTPNGCTYRVDLPDRAAYDIPVVAYAFRSCKQLPKDTGLSLDARRVAAQIEGATSPACATKPDCMIEAHITLKVQKDGSYPFVLRTDDDDLLAFTIDHDALAGMKAALGDIFRLMSFLPILLGVGLAFYSDVLKAVRAWFRRGQVGPGEAAAAPAAPGEPGGGGGVDA